MADFNPSDNGLASNLSPDQAAAQRFNMQFNSKFNEQFNEDFNKQEQIYQSNPKFLRTRQSVEAERRNVIGAITDNAPYHMFEENALKPTTFRKQATAGILECNLVNQVFLSQENIDLLQDKIRYAVWRASDKKFVIDRQNQIELELIMRSIYLQYSKNLQYNIKEQVEELNDLVIQDTVPKIMSQVQAHVYYLFDASTQPIPLSHAVNVNSTGRKQLPSVTSVFFN